MARRPLFDLLVCQRSAVRQHGGRVRKCLTILFHFTSSFVSFITLFLFLFLNARSHAYSYNGKAGKDSR